MRLTCDAFDSSPVSAAAFGVAVAAGIGLWIILHWPRSFPGPLTEGERTLAALPAAARKALAVASPLTGVAVLLSLVCLAVRPRCAPDGVLDASVARDQATAPVCRGGVVDLGVPVEQALQRLAEECARTEGESSCTEQAVLRDTRLLERTRRVLKQTLIDWRMAYGCQPPQAGGARSSDFPRWLTESIELSIVDFALSTRVMRAVHVRHDPPLGRLRSWSLLQEAVGTVDLTTHERWCETGIDPATTEAYPPGLSHCVRGAEGVTLMRIGDAHWRNAGGDSVLSFRAQYRLGDSRNAICEDVTQATSFSLLAAHAGNSRALSCGAPVSPGGTARGGGLMCALDVRCVAAEADARLVLQFGGLTTRPRRHDDVAMEASRIIVVPPGRAAGLQDTLDAASRNSAFLADLQAVGAATKIATTDRREDAVAAVQIGPRGVVVSRLEPGRRVPPYCALSGAGSDKTTTWRADLADPVLGRSPFSWTGIAVPVPPPVQFGDAQSSTPVVRFARTGAVFIEARAPREGSDVLGGAEPDCVLIHLLDADQRFLGGTLWEPATGLALARSIHLAVDCLRTGDCSADRLLDLGANGIEPAPLLTAEDMRDITNARRRPCDLGLVGVVLLYLLLLRVSRRAARV